MSETTIGITTMPADNLGFIKVNVQGGKVRDCSLASWYYGIPGSSRLMRNVVAQHFLDCRDLSVGLGFAKM